MAIQFESSIEVVGSASVFGDGYVESLFIGNFSGQISNRIWFDTGGSPIPGLYFEGGQPKFIIYSSVSNIFHDTYHPNADIWTTARTITIGNTGKSVNGSANVSWSLAEIGAVSGSGTTNNLTKWSSASTITDSLFSDDGSTITLSTNGGSNTFDLSHTSGGGVALNITKGGNGEALLINKTSGSGNAVSITGDSYFNGDVGIGTDSPNTTLEVDGAISTTTSDYAQGSTGSRLLLETSGSGNTHSYIQAQSSGGTSNAEDLALQLYGGNVGIGTSSPGAKLEVNGNIDVNDSGDRVFVADGSNGTFSLGDLDGLADEAQITGNASTIKINNGGSTTLTSTFNNRIGIGTTSPQAKLHVANGTLRTWTPTTGTSAIFESTASNRNFLTITATNESEIWFGDATTQAKGRVRYENNNNTMELWTSGNPRINIDSTGNVAIGATTATEKLVVSGNSWITNNVYVGLGNTLKSCTYTAQHSLVVGQSNTLGGIANGIIGVSNTIDCTNEPWSLFGGNFIAGKNNTINNLYSHANAVFGQSNTVGDPTTSSNSVAGILVSGVGTFYIWK